MTELPSPPKIAEENVTNFAGLLIKYHFIQIAEQQTIAKGSSGASAANPKQIRKLMKNLHCLPKRIIIKHAQAGGLGLGLGCGWGCGSLRSTSGGDQLYRRALILRLVLGAIRGPWPRAL